jgi:hypothetical protein
MTEITINPDYRYILSATESEVMLDGFDDDIECVLRVSRETYFAAITAWLDNKMDYACRYNGEYCGVGSIEFEGQRDYKQKAYLNDRKGNPVPANVYTADKFSIDMEHG